MESFMALDLALRLRRGGAVPHGPSAACAKSTAGAAFSGMCALCDKLRNARGWPTLYSDKVASMNDRNYSLLGLATLSLGAGLLAACASTNPAKPAAAPH